MNTPQLPQSWMKSLKSGGRRHDRGQVWCFAVTLTRKTRFLSTYRGVMSTTGMPFRHYGAYVMSIVPPGFIPSSEPDARTTTWGRTAESADHHVWNRRHRGGRGR